ncbi:MAG: fatty acid CoA ligase family protein [Planctomycetota bacterium]|nr:fatty acid CoA ligase family protein [Planctomycetota bacterium]
MTVSEAKVVVNIAKHLPEMAKRLPYHKAVVFPEGRDKQGRVTYTHYTCAQLNEKSDIIAAGLVKVGITRGVRSVLMVKPCLDFFALTFALFKIGAVPVLVDPGMGTKNLGQCLAEAQPEAFIGIPKAHVGRILLGWGKKTLKTLVTVGSKLFWGGYTLSQIEALGKAAGPFQMAETQSEDMAAVLFTSGSTGVPKGAVYSHGNFAAQVESLKDTYHIEPGEMDLATFPLFGLFGPALGMTTIIPDMDATKPAEVDPEKINEAIQNFGATNMFGSPALLNRVSSYGVKHGYQWPSLKRVISAGAPVPGDVLDRVHSMLGDDVEVFTPYGATESLPVASIGSRTIVAETFVKTGEGKGVCVGAPVAKVEVQIIKISDDPIESWSEDLLVSKGEIGEIIVRGPRVTRSYFNRDASTKISKIVREDGSFHHRMGDLGYFDDQGRLWFCGRKSHRVVTKAGCRFTVPCEGVFNTHPGVYRSALVGPVVNGAVKAVLCVELNSEPAALKPLDALRKELLELGQSRDSSSFIDTILFHPSFPVDIRHNSKIFREKLKVWAEGELK